MDDAGDEWQARWSEGRIGFHRDAVHPMLAGYWPSLGAPGDSDVLVPLCGKSVDMRWLEGHGHSVTGVDRVAAALAGFAAEDPRVPERLRHEGIDGLRLGRITLWRADIFHLPLGNHGRMAFYDRAALVALPAPTRMRYAVILAQLCAPGAVGLLITVHRPGRAGEGPPYLVDEEELERLFGANFRLRALGRGVDAAGAEEFAWRLERKGNRGS